MITNLATVMSTRTSIFLFAFLLTSAWGKYNLISTDETIEKGAYPQNFTESLTLKEFVRLVEEKKLNVSLIASTGKNYDDDNVKETIALTITFPVNEESITEATLKKEDFQKLLKVANEEKITVAGTVSEGKKADTIYSNNLKGVPINKAYKIFTGIKNGKTGFVFDEENYVAQYTFITPGADGKNTTTKIFYGDVDVEVTDKSSNVKDEDLVTIKKAVVDAYFTFGADLVSRGITSILGSTLPGHSWDAAADVGEHNYIDSDYWVQLKLLNENYIVYAS